MNKHFRLLLSLAIFVSLTQFTFAQSIYKNYKDGQLYLKLKNDVSIALPEYDGKSTEGYSKSFIKIINKYGVYSVQKAFPHLKTVELEHTYKIQFHQTKKVSELIKALQKISTVDYAEKVPLHKILLTPNDPSYANQFALPLISGPAAWVLSTGNHNVKVAVVDNAVMINHTDLAANKWVNPGEIPNNGLDDDGDGYIDDVNGYDVADNDNNPNPPASASTTNFEHGTHCGGIADAVSNNSLGVASIGYGLSLIGVKCEPDNTTNPDQITYAMEGVQYAISAGANVISMSWGGGGFSQTEQNIFTAGWNQGIIFCAAAGNDGMDETFYPAQYAHVLAVGSTTNTDAVSSFSNFGTWIGVMAPGSNIYSTLPGTNGASSYGSLSGTSMATPMVAGLCGLMKAYSPFSTNTQIVACLKSSCTNIDAQNSSYVGKMGSGRINAYAALECLTAPPVADFKGDVTQSCSGIVHFTDLSTGSPVSWAWNFGDGGTSTQQNPAHEYFTNGNFTVALTVTNSQGSSPVTKTNYITVSKPNAPAATGGTHCGTGTVSLAATSTNTVRWYSSPTTPDPVATGNTFVTPSLSNSTTYYVEDSVAGTTSVVPATDSILGAASSYSNSTDRYLTFDCLSSCILKNVLVYANGAGTRVIELRDATGTVLQSFSANLANGANTVTLNFVLPVATNLELGINGTANLFRNNAVTTGFPFTLAGQVSITGSNAGAGFYYYFYNWQIQSAGCVSLRAPVVATITSGFLAGLTATNVSCYNGSNGSLTPNVLGGTGTYTYLWNNNQTTSTLSSLAPGFYSVVITDVTGCSVSATSTITQPAAISSSTTITNVACTGGNTGSINLTVTGGTTNYTYDWGSGITTQNRTGLSAGSYSVTITDAHACIATAAATISQPTTALTATETSANGGCGSSAGSAGVTAIGGTTGYSYSWSNSSTTTSISNLPSGTYSVTVTDANSCTASASAVVNNSGSLSITPAASPASCYGSSTGSATLTVSGATNPVTYNWSNGSTISSITNVAAGTYTVTVVDGAGCSATLSQAVSQPTAVSATLSTTSAGCSLSNGSATANVAGGTSGYSYNWSNSAITASLANLPAGTYSLTVTDSHGCTATTSGIINNSGSLTASPIANNVACNGGSDGSVLLTVTGATNPVTYSWSDGSSASFLTGIAAGTYNVTVTDASGCSAIVSQTLTQPVAVSATAVTNNVICFGDASGSAQLNVSGGSAPYIYAWSNGNTTPNITGIAAGNYNVTITDSHNCSATSTASVTQPNPLQITTTSTDAVTGQGNGSASVVNIYNAVSPYTFAWSNGASTQTISNLVSGIYTVTLTDANGCQKTGTAVVDVSTDIGSINGDIVFSIYPNPAKTELFVAVDQLTAPVTLTVKNVLGQTLVSKTITGLSTQFDVTQIASGVYFAEVTRAEKKMVKEFVVTK